MALPTLGVWEIRTTGSASNAGGFTAGGAGTDYSQQDAAQVSFDGTTIKLSNASASATATVTGATPDGTWVDNFLNITGGTNFTVGVYRILSTASGTVTFDRAATTGAGAAGAGKLGGAKVSLGDACASAVAGNRFWVKSGTYTVTSASSNVNNGCVTLPASTGTNSSHVLGYQTTRGDFAARPIIKADGVITTLTLISTTGGNVVECLEIDGNSRTSSRGVQNVTSDVRNCVIRNCTNSAVNGSSALSRVSRSFITGCSTQPAVAGSSVYSCDVSGNTNIGVFLGAGGECIDTLVCNNTGASSDGIQTAGTACLIYGVTAYGNGRDNFRITTGTAYVDSCISYDAGAIGFNLTLGGVTNPTFINCAAGGLGTNFSTNVSSLNNITSITLLGDPFVDKANGNFALNATAGAGLLCRGVATVGTYVSGSTTAHFDLGAVQHGDPTQPAAANVLTGISYNDGLTAGTLTLAGAGNVLTGVTFGVGGTSVVGTLTLPLASKVLNDQTYGVAGTGSTGTLTLTPGTNVVSGVTFGVGGTSVVGNVILPTVSQVSNGVVYGANGNQFTGIATGGTYGQTAYFG